MVFYGQLVIGAPGAGKTTYCKGLLDILQSLKRRIVVINLDPANDYISFKCDINIQDLITVEDAMNNLGLGPNGALRYCIKTLAKNLNWLKKQLELFENCYLVIDMPGNLELYNNDNSISSILEEFKKWKLSLSVVYLSDSIYVSDPGRFISVVLCALCVMINLEMPQINVLSKIDLMPEDAPFNLQFFEQLPDMQHIVELLNDHPILSTYKKINRELCDVIDNYNLVNFVPLNVLDKEKMLNLLRLADDANGFNIANISDIRSVIKENIS